MCVCVYVCFGICVYVSVSSSRYVYMCVCECVLFKVCVYMYVSGALYGMYLYVYARVSSVCSSRYSYPIITTLCIVVVDVLVY